MIVMVNIPEVLAEFLGGQVHAGYYPSRSAALTEALALWRDTQLQPFYTEAFASIDPLWDLVAGDGIDDEQRP